MGTKPRSKKKKSKEAQAAAPNVEQSDSSTTGQIPSWIFVAFALLGVAIFALVLLGTDPPPEVESTIRTVNPVDTWQAAPVTSLTYVAERDYAIGPDDPAVSVAVFSDFECPYCQDASSELRRLYERYPDNVQLVFRNYPLDMSCNENMKQTGHLYSCKAAVMARCAGAQDHFWEMHDAIFELPQLNVSTLDGLPEELGLSAEAFTACVGNEQTMADVQVDIEEGRTLGLTGTPAVFVNGRKMASFRTTTLSAIVDHVLFESGSD